MLYGYLMGFGWFAWFGFDLLAVFVICVYVGIVLYCGFGVVGWVGFMLVDFGVFLGVCLTAFGGSMIVDFGAFLGFGFSGVFSVLRSDLRG